MLRSAKFGLSLCVFALGLQALSAQSPASAPQQQAPVFRSRTTVIPVDVRVLDRDGKAVKDLTAADFTVLENGKPQKVDYFAANQLKEMSPDASPSVRLNAASSGALAPQNRRLFLIVLGRG